MGVMRSSDETGGNPILRRLKAKARRRKTKRSVATPHSKCELIFGTLSCPAKAVETDYKGIMFDVDSAKAIKFQRLKYHL